MTGKSRYKVIPLLSNRCFIDIFTSLLFLLLFNKTNQYVTCSLRFIFTVLFYFLKFYVCFQFIFTMFSQFFNYDENLNILSLNTMVMRVFCYVVFFPMNKCA